MIVFNKLWETMKEKDITQYDLYTYYEINRSQLHRLRKNQNVETNTINKLCSILDCEVSDIMTYVPEKNSMSR